MDIPHEHDQRDVDQETLNKEEIHKMNKENERHAEQHENPNANLGREHNPIHHGIGNK
jgi:hypothetical protein